ncbi:tripeptidyl-peptidase 2 [Phlebotomus argentipes]|uniref:tripeptidyl-peptidase 2 n=1 Tax=Phlebotomus argentipes TaxID=94469 RepID=UPI0028933F02|nr:tripeptidyl-peptidase 2 [Phlebotomus argentipes]
MDSKFPLHALVPKNETGASNFLAKYPEFDGRDVTIAVLDSGVDSRARGLQWLPGKEVKVIERFDCSGTGDVDMTKKVTANQGVIVGLSGRNLKVSSLMKKVNANGEEFRVGLKSLYDLYPTKIREKIIAENKVKCWDESHKTCVADVCRKLEEFDQSHPNNVNNLPYREKLRKENLDASLEMLNFCEKKFTEFKTTYDCVLFPTDKGWMAVIDTTETGDLENAVHIKEYSGNYDTQVINEYLSISVNVHNGGNVLEIVGMCSSHGTHVSAIACGHQPDNRALDGVAPGAKVVSLAIGDGRLGSMETGTGVVRAIMKIMELCNAGRRIDVVNMSYGEHAHWSNAGRIGELIGETVNKYGVIWVGSAGNHGPALCTIGTPPDINQAACVGVGAYVSPDMMEAEYAMRAKYGDVYTWTSRDPCIDGGAGVTICAPGAAITSVPEFTLSQAQLMNGTSMAAPHVAGAVALLISGLRQRKIPYSPYSIKRALSNTATKLKTVDPFAQGSGLLNVERAFEHLVDNCKEAEVNVRFNINVSNNNAKGIHIRHGVLSKPEEFSVNVEPVFFNDKNTASSEKIAFNVRLVLTASDEWVQCGKFLDLCYSARSFSVRIDPCGLRPGVHQSSVKAYDSKNVDKGPVFEVPITVVQPIVVGPDQLFVHRIPEQTYLPNTIVRQFISVPRYATWAVLKLKAEDNVGGKFFVHTVQILPAKYCRALETQKIVSVCNESDTLLPFKCEGDNILEICIAKYWSNLGQTNISASVEFHGIYSANGNIMHAANGIHRIDIRALKVEEILPSICLKNAVAVLRPTESSITPLTARDVLPPSRQIYQNVLTYSLNLTKHQEFSLHAPLFSNVLYESEFESQFWMIFDKNCMMVGCGDAYSYRNFIKLEKGEYTIRLQVRHEKKELLEKVSEATIIATFKLPSSIYLDVYKSFGAASTGGKKIAAFQMSNKAPKTIFVTPLTNEKITKAGFPNQCAWLDGTVTYSKDEHGRKVDSVSFQYNLIEGAPVKKANGVPKENKSKLEEYKEGLRDYQNGMIPKLELTDAEEIYQELITSNPKYLAAHVSLIQNLETAEPKTQLPHAYALALEKIEDKKPLKATLNRIIDLADLVIRETDVEALLSYYGIKSDTRPDAAKIKANMDKQKAVLLEAYQKKIIAMGKLHVATPTPDDLEEILTEVDEVFTGIAKFSDVNDAKYLPVGIWHAFLHKHFGRMGKYLHKLYEEKQQREILEEQLRVFRELNWSHVEKVIDRIIVNANPQTYRLF